MSIPTTTRPQPDETLTTRPRDLATKRPAAVAVVNGRTVAARPAAVRGGPKPHLLVMAIVLLFAAAGFAGLILSLIQQS